MKAEVFYFFIFLLACFPVFWLLNLNIVKKFTYKPEERYLQFRVFIVGFLFSIIFGNTMSASFALTVIDMFINSPNVSGFLNMILPNRAFELLYMLLCTIGLNVMYMLAFTVALGAARLIFIKAKRFIEFNDCVGAEKIFHAPWFIVNKFYSMKDDRVVLSKTGYVIGKWCKVMKRAFAVIFAAELGILYYSILWGSDAWNSAVLAVSKAVYLLPMLAFVLIEQLQLFFEAPEDTENGTVSSTDTNEELIGDLGALTYKYSETFGPVGNIICIDTRKDTYQRSAAYVGKDLANQQIMDCREPEILKVLNNQLSSSVTMQNIHYQNAVVSLLNGSDITVRDNFDGEFLVYLCTYLNHFLMQGRRVLFLCAREKDIMTIKAALEKTLGRMNNLGGVWKYAALGEFDYAGNTNALICTYEELIHTDLRSDYAGFADDLFFTVIADANTFLQLDNIRLSLIFGKLSALRVMQQYAFITDTYAPAVESRIKVFLGNKRGLAAYSNDARTPNTDIIVWKDESSYKPQCTIFREGYRASPHLGTALPLALIAVKDDIPQVSIVSHPERGDSYFFDVAGRSNAQRIVEYLESPEYDLKSIIRYLPAEAGDTKDLKLLFVYDTEYNFINTLWKWLKYGGTKGTLINVISPF
ncbi:MAG: hypothetical protein IKQ90_05410, partial [Ruminococcus sp.]|nr:hypothetical protein [Ruminococcus sp.]